MQWQGKSLQTKTDWQRVFLMQRKKPCRNTGLMAKSLLWMPAPVSHQSCCLIQQLTVVLKQYGLAYTEKESHECVRF